jgi:proteasome lid subunit RPN8/RPN11
LFTLANPNSRSEESSSTCPPRAACSEDLKSPFSSLYNLGMERALRSRRKVYGQILKHARLHPHRECCGILAGQDNLITRAFPAKNVALDPIRNYEIAPTEILHLMAELRKRQLHFLGIYHSHPHWMDPNEPSPKDIALAHYHQAVHLIVTPRPYATTPIRAFSIRDGRPTELEIQILP